MQRGRSVWDDVVALLSLLASADNTCVVLECAVFPLQSRFGLLSQVTGSVIASPPVKPRSSLKNNVDSVLSVHLVFQGHVVASAAPPAPCTPPHQTGKYQPSCPDTVNHFLPTGVSSHMFLFMEPALVLFFFLFFFT